MSCIVGGGASCARACLKRTRTDLIESSGSTAVAVLRGRSHRAGLNVMTNGVRRTRRSEVTRLRRFRNWMPDLLSSNRRHRRTSLRRGHELRRGTRRRFGRANQRACRGANRSRLGGDGEHVGRSGSARRVRRFVDATARSGVSLLCGLEQSREARRFRFVRACERDSCSTSGRGTALRNPISAPCARAPLQACSAFMAAGELTLARRRRELRQTDQRAGSSSCQVSARSMTTDSRQARSFGAQPIRYGARQVARLPASSACARARRGVRDAR